MILRGNDTIIPRGDSELKNQTYVILLSCFLVGILLFKYAELHMPETFSTVPPQRLLLAGMGGAGAYYVMKYGLYLLCHWTFFTPSQRQAWLSAYNLLFLAKALLFFPIVLLVVYFDLSAFETLKTFTTVSGLWR